MTVELRHSKATLGLIPFEHFRIDRSRWNGMESGITETETKTEYEIKYR